MAFPHLYYDRKGKPIDQRKWAELFESVEYRIIGSLEENDIHISTVWLGLDHNWGRGAPLIFETMIFGGPYDQRQWRWHTENEAEQAHQVIVTAFREGMDPDVAVEAWRKHFFDPDTTQH